MSKPFIVGIAGGSASGKSTFARGLAERLGGLQVEIVPMDRYFREDKPVHAGPLNGREWPDYNQPGSFHLDRLVADLGDVQADVVIVEGLMTLHADEVRECCDLKLFVDAQADERIVRRLKRNMAERGLSFDEIADYYLDSVRYRHQEFVEPSRWFADLVINGALPTDKAASIIACHIRTTLGAGE